MTVEELIEALQQWPGDMRVVHRGYEGGHTEVEKLATRGLVLCEHAPGHEGEWQRDEAYVADNWKSEPRQAEYVVILEGKRH